MSITKKAWITYRDKGRSRIHLKEPIAIVGSSGLRSVGKIVVDELVKKTDPGNSRNCIRMDSQVFITDPRISGLPMLQVQK